MNSAMNSGLNSAMNSAMNSGMNSAINSVVASASHSAARPGLRISRTSRQTRSTSCAQIPVCPTRCPTSGTQVDLVLPKYVTMQGQFWTITDDSGNEQTVTINESGNNVVYRILMGTALACADRAFHPLFLSPTPLKSTTGVAPLRDRLRYMCIKFKDANTCAVNVGRLLPVALCRGHQGCVQRHERQPDQCKLPLADLVLRQGHAGPRGRRLRHQGLLPAHLHRQSLTWGDLTYSYHFEFDKGLGAIGERIPRGSRMAIRSTTNGT